MTPIKTSKPSKPATALTHLDERGAARMVDVGGKIETVRRALARAVVTLSAAAYRALADGTAAKGDALAVARVAGIQAAKRTSDLIPLCHPLPITKAKVEFEFKAARREVHVLAEVQCEGKTGVEMEALTAASVAALTLYDMLKAVDKGIVIGPIELLEKDGGKSGPWRKEAAAKDKGKTKAKGRGES